jgi:hypothetical protein
MKRRHLAFWHETDMAVRRRMSVIEGQADLARTRLEV